MTSENLYLIRYDEIGLKGGNRRNFEKKLVGHIKSSLSDLGDIQIKRIRGRILLFGDLSRREDIESRLKCIPGLHSFSLGSSCEHGLEQLKSAVLDTMKRCWDGKKPIYFRISAKRSYKAYPLSAIELNIALGSHLVQHYGSDKLTVSLDNPDIDISAEIQKESAVVFEGRQKGIGGLPVGTAGRLLCLLSGGIDSPVAAFQMIRRGCRVDYIFFENRVFLGRAAYDKVRKLAEILGKFQPSARLYVIPFTDVQVAVRDLCTDRHRVILYRRFMYRIAETILQKGDGLGLINGEALGQVASQTLENINAVQDVVKSTVYRPLISMDKVEIMKIARNIGTYDVSIEDAPDCCSVFMPARPATRAKIPWLQEDEAKLDLPGLVQKSIEGLEVIDIKGFRHRAS
jgi:thiamine biosynthesis protein ThiI